jgi:hypothetical protein
VRLTGDSTTYSAVINTTSIANASRLLAMPRRNSRSCATMLSAVRVASSATISLPRA